MYFFLNTWFWNRIALCKTFEVLTVCRSYFILCAVLWPFIFHVLNLETILIWYWDNAVCRHQLLAFIKMTKPQAIRFGTPKTDVLYCPVWCHSRKIRKLPTTITVAERCSLSTFIWWFHFGLLFCVGYFILTFCRNILSTFSGWLNWYMWLLKLCSLYVGLR